MPKQDNPFLSPQILAEAAIQSNIATAIGIKKIFELMLDGETEEAFTGFKLLIEMLAENDAVLRSVYDACDGIDTLPYFYTSSNRCECGASLRFPLVWNRRSRTTGKYICASVHGDPIRCNAK
jgi:hypothetical protein